MKKSFALLALNMGIIALVAGCTQSGDEISRDTKPFDEISEAATVSVSGTEPFWDIEIVPQDGIYQATYSSPDNPEGSSFSVNRFAGNNGVSFSGEVYDDPVQIALTPGECNDGMSERTYPYFATVLYAGQELQGCGYTSDEPFTGDEAP